MLREKKQDIIINITLSADLKKACKTDNIDNTIDYSSLKKKVLRFVEQSSYFLIEALAHKIAEICLEDHIVKIVKVRVGKPGALRFARTVEVEVVRKQEEH